MAARRDGDAAALGPAAFAERLDALGPFEPAPRLAVAVSGGADSLALVLLAADWARARGGSVLALTVDHGLRPEAAEEARQVAAWLAPLGIDHRILRGALSRPGGDVQAAARRLRYGLLLDTCREEGILHLLLGHHRDDQAETLLLRLARGSGLGGLAGMAAVSYRAEARLLRPLLDVPRAALEATLRGRGQPWIDDPSNRDPAYARVRLRRSADLLAAEGLTAERLAATAARLGRARQAIEDAADALLAGAVVIDPRGWAHLDPVPLRAAPEEVGLRVLADLLCAVGGREHPPRGERLERLRETLGSAATLHGCRLVSAGNRLLVVREARGIDHRHGLRGGDALLWDGRFRLRLVDDAPEVAIGPLRATDWSVVARACPTAAGAVPAPARRSLPAVYDASGLLSVPHLGYNREAEDGVPARPVVETLRFTPRRPAGALGFRLARGRSRIM